jgi:hypothetical protein
VPGKESLIPDTSAAYLKLLHRWRKIPFRSFKWKKRRWNHSFAGAHDFPKFVKDGC